METYDSHCSWQVTVSLCTLPSCLIYFWGVVLLEIDPNPGIPRAKAGDEGEAIQNSHGTSEPSLLARVLMMRGKRGK
ncbi:hypothetical protein K440DRAFT_628780 [Wilcoxina mikolae CBS 423.85]|nr:hypothetical protein K440DRAFT_628780 [Wilcoxina mikolae CBS 423.85]